MGGLAEQAVDRARQAYLDATLTRCQMVLEGESLINTAEREIDELPSTCSPCSSRWQWISASFLL